MTLLGDRAAVGLRRPRARALRTHLRLAAARSATPGDDARRSRARRCRYRRLAARRWPHLARPLRNGGTCRPDDADARSIRDPQPRRPPDRRPAAFPCIREGRFGQADHHRHLRFDDVVPVATRTIRRRKGLDAVAEEYVRSVNAGAVDLPSARALHGRRRRSSPTAPSSPTSTSPAGAGCATASSTVSMPIIQYGIANGRFPQRKELMEDQQPDMISICFNAHDECFDYEPGNEPVELYAIHDRDELKEYCELTARTRRQDRGRGLPLRRRVERHAHDREGPHDGPVWVTFFLGWKGGCWTPPTVKAMIYMADHCPDEFHLEHQRHGPGGAVEGAVHRDHARRPRPRRHGGQSRSSTPGEYARSNAELVEKIVRIARDIGREIASPDEARAIAKLEERHALGGRREASSAERSAERRSAGPREMPEHPCAGAAGLLSMRSAGMTPRVTHEGGGPESLRRRRSRSRRSTIHCPAPTTPSFASKPAASTAPT